MDAARVFVWRVRLFLLAMAVGLIGVEADRRAPVSQAIRPTQPSPTVTPLAALPVKGEPVKVGSGSVSRSLSEPVKREQPRMAVAQSPDLRCSGRTVKSPDSLAARKSTRAEKSNDCKPAAGAPGKIKAGVSGQRKPSAPMTKQRDTSIGRIGAQPVVTPPAIEVTSDRRPKSPAPS
jgi:hypothetical protein